MECYIEPFRLVGLMQFIKCWCEKMTFTVSCARIRNADQGHRYTKEKVNM